MSREEILMKLNEVFCEVFDDDNLVIDENTTAADIEDWDSLEHVNLIFACGERFGLKFDISDMGKMKNVREIMEMIGEKRKERN